MLSDRFDDREMYPHTIITTHGFLTHWTNDYHDSLKPLLYGHQVGMETGDVNSELNRPSCHALLLGHDFAAHNFSFAKWR